MKKVSTSSEIYGAILSAVKNTHGDSHAFEATIRDVFELNKPSEEINYQPFAKKLHNKFLLWHGVRPTSIV